MTRTGITVTLCATCPLGREGFAARLREALATRSSEVQVTTVECMSGCTRPSTLAARAPGKTAYLFGDLTDADLPLIENFVRLYHASTDGNFPDARVLGRLRCKAIARIPAEPDEGRSASAGSVVDSPRDSY